MVSFTFNLGAGNLAVSTLLKVLNGGKYEAVPNQLRRWVNAGGKRLEGLVRRREAEAELWNEPMTIISESTTKELPIATILSKIRIIQNAAAEIGDLLENN